MAEVRETLVAEGQAGDKVMDMERKIITPRRKVRKTR